MEPSRSDTARTRWLALTPPARQLKPQPQPDVRARFPEEHRLPLRPAPPSGLRWGSVPADALPETQKGERKRSKPTTNFDFGFYRCDKLNPTGQIMCYENRTSSRATDSITVCECLNVF